VLNQTIKLFDGREQKDYLVALILVRWSSTFLL